jgi:hypothetical protein
MTIDEVIALLAERRAQAVQAVDRIRAYRQQVDEGARQLENPRAAVEFADFFIDFLARAVSGLEEIAGELAVGVRRPQIDALRQLASNAAAEQRRCLVFRDRCINKPLPYEQMRPLLSGLSTSARDELDALRQLSAAAAALEPLVQAGASEEDSRSFDRRALFTRLFRPEGGEKR